MGADDGEIYSRVDSIESREDLRQFVAALNEDLKDHPGSWENVTLEAHLEVLAELLESADVVYENLGREIPVQPTWRLFGEPLLASKYYE
ncbi:DUF7660 family protein [Promicromonospora aerolata]|uniref:DUF7660 domain-containing protein n=1 Tax=Promicromonospora aerolata TaxID=195749 RepID=A0ABW4V8Z6_9MICO